MPLAVKIKNTQKIELVFISKGYKKQKTYNNQKHKMLLLASNQGNVN